MRRGDVRDRRCPREPAFAGTAAAPDDGGRAETIPRVAAPPTWTRFRTRRSAVQSFVDVCSPGDEIGVLVAPLNSFCLRLDLDPITFEALGNDTNYREVTKDQSAVTDFRFRYSLRGYTGQHDRARAVSWARSVASPLVATSGEISYGQDASAPQVDPDRAVAPSFAYGRHPASRDRLTSKRSGTAVRCVPICWSATSRSCLSVAAQ